MPTKDKGGAASAEAAWRESEERYRKLFDTIEEGFCIVEVLVDERGDPCDLVYRDLNRAFEEMSGIPNPLNRRTSEVSPNLEPRWLDTCERVFKTGTPIREENYLAANDRWFNMHFSLMGDPGSRFIAVIFQDITVRKKAEIAQRDSEARQAFLLNLSDALRPKSDPVEIQDTAVRLLAEHLDVVRATFFEVDADGDGFTLTARRERNAAPVPERMRLSDFGPQISAAYRAGQTVVFRDTETETHLGSRPEMYRGLGLRAWIATPLVKDGQLIAVIAVNSAAARDWTEAQVRTVEDVAERTWAAVERARAGTALRKSEEKYRTLFECIDEGICVIELIEATAEKAADFRYVEVNASHGRQSGLGDVTGKLGSEVVPGAETYWYEAYGEIIRTGEPKRIEAYNQDTDRWYNAFASRVGDRESRLVCVVSQDITERKWHEERQAFLFKLSDALRAETGVEAVGSRAVEMIRDQLGVDRVYLVQLTPGDDKMSVSHEARRGGLPPMIGTYRGSDFPNALKELFEHTIVYSDVRADPRLTELDRRSFDGMDAAGFIAAPIRGGGDLISGAGAVSSTPRSWSANEIALFEDAIERTGTAVQRARAEAALRESQNLLARTFDAMPMGIGVLDKDGVVRRLNPQMKYFLPNAIIPSLEPARVARWQGWDSEGKPVMPQNFPSARALRGEKVTPGLEMLFEDDNGRKLWTEVSSVPLQDENGAVTGAISIVFNIDAQKRSEEVLRESEERQAFLLKLSDALRAETGVEAVGSRAVEMIRDQLAVDRVYLVQLTPDDDKISVSHEARREGLPPMTGTYRGPDFPNALKEFLEHTIVYDDVRTDPRLTELDRRSFDGMGAAGFIAAPIRRGRDVISGSGAVSSTPRSWSANEIALFEDAIDRAWGALERARAETALRTSEERLRQFGEASQDVLWIRDAETLRWVYLTPAFEEIYGISREDALGRDDFHTWTQLILPEDREAAIQGIERVREGGTAAFEYRIRRPVDGEIRWLRNTDFPIADDTGKVTMIGGVGHDVTQIKKAEEHQKLLLAELQHRVRNTLAVIRSIARMTAESSPSVEDMGMHLDGRIAAFARVQAAVTRDPLKGVDLETLLLDTLASAARKDEAYSISGPAFKFAPKAAETFALVFHELTTNAIKYGALSVRTGHVSVNWKLDGNADNPSLDLVWIETGVRAAKADGGREGFGTELLTRMLAYEMKASVLREFTQEGIRYLIKVPLSQITRPGRA